MKKIIELAENYLVGTRILTLEGDYYKCGVGYELAKAIEHRRKLEQTPITEDWLKEHGWQRSTSDKSSLYPHKWWISNSKGRMLQIRYDGEGWEIYPLWIFNIDNIAQLLDAMELCGINLED